MTEINFPHLTIYPTTDQIEYQELHIEDGAFANLLTWARENDLSLHHDPESDENVTGYFIRDTEGNQIAAATLTER